MNREGGGAPLVGPLVELTGVAKFYGAKLVFKNVGLRLDRGRLLLLAGHNGAGKSTLLKIIAGVSRPDAGTARLGVQAGRVGYLGHDTFNYPKLTAVENLRFWAALHGRKVDGEGARQALERVGLGAVAEERAGVFSRGMAQRLSLARVFLLEPELALLDEPFTGLDAASRRTLWAEIEAAKARGVGFVLISHAVREDLARADLALLLANRRGAYCGPAEGFPAEEATAC